MITVQMNEDYDASRNLGWSREEAELKKGDVVTLIPADNLSDNEGNEYWLESVNEDYKYAEYSYGILIDINKLPADLK
jgi:hypothetical protein